MSEVIIPSVCGVENDSPVPSESECGCDMNTRTEDGLVPKGSGHALSAYATDKYGNPSWKSSLVLGGSLTIENHSSPIGTVKHWRLPRDTAIPNGIDPTPINTGVTLEPGVWVVSGTGCFEHTLRGGIRGFGIRIDDAHAVGITVNDDVENQAFVILMAKTYVFEVTEPVVMRAVFMQMSGESLNAKSSATTIDAVRIA